MPQTHCRIRYVGGPTVVIEIAGFRLLTDPTFDPAGTSYPTAKYTLMKTAGPRIEIADLGHIDAVLLSHDHHFDNLDHKGRELLGSIQHVLTTKDGAARLGSNAVGLAPWQEFQLHSPQGSTLKIVALPGRHGSAEVDRGPVLGFYLEDQAASGSGVYLSGDTVWYEAIEEITQRFNIGVAVLFMGAACVKEVSAQTLTFTASEALEAARAMPGAPIVPVHYEDWAHFSESRQEIERAFSAAGMAQRLHWIGREGLIV